MPADNYIHGITVRLCKKFLFVGVKQDVENFGPNNITLLCIINLNSFIYS